MKPCSHCGSVNHRALDCSHQDRVWKPTPAQQKALEAEKRASDPSLKPDSLPVSRPVAAFSAYGRPKVAETGISGPVFEPKPRFKNAPPTCTATNLLAHDDDKALKKFLATCGASIAVERQWVCEACGKIHISCYISHSTIGKRLAQPPEGWVLMIPEKVQREMSERAAAIRRGGRSAIELPSQGKAAKEVTLPKGKKKPTEKGLF